MDALIIGGAVLDVVYQAKPTGGGGGGLNAAATAPTPTATMMFSTSTPCKLARCSAGGVGRNVSEAMGRLGARVNFRSIVGGSSAAPAAASGDGTGEGGKEGGPLLVADTNGKAVLAAMEQVKRECQPGAYSYSCHVATGEPTPSDDDDDKDGTKKGVRGSGLPSSSASASASSAVAPATSTATYMALLDGAGELVAAAAVMGIFDDHFTPTAAMEGTPLMTASILPLAAASAPPPRPLPQWVVLDGNVPQATLEAVCQRVHAINNATAARNPHANANNKSHNGPIIRIAYDPISKEKALRCLNVLHLIDLMKPNEFESIAIGMQLALNKQQQQRQHQEGGGEGEQQQQRLAQLAHSHSGSSEVAVVSVAENREPSAEERLATLVRAVQMALRGWAARNKPFLWPEEGEGEQEEKGDAATPVLDRTIAADDTMEGIVTLCAAAASKLNRSNNSKKKSSATSTTSAATSTTTAQSVMWQVFNELSLREKQCLAVVAAVYVAAAGGVGRVLCTLGKEGCWAVSQVKDNHERQKKAVVTARHLRSIPIPPHRLTKVTGAGDSFLSGYLYGLLADEKNKNEREREGTEKQNLLLPASLTYAEQCAVLAAASALVSPLHTINPMIRSIVVGDGDDAKTRIQKYILGPVAQSSKL